MTNRDDILAEFAMEEAMTHTVLLSYITRYPELADDLLELFNELALSDLEVEQSTMSLEAKAMNAETLRVQQVEAALFGNGVRELAKEVGLPRFFLMGLQASAVHLGSLPFPLIKRLAQSIGVRTQDVILGMQRGGDQTFAMKSEIKPHSADQVEFDEYVEQASLSEEQHRTLQEVIDANGSH